VVGGGLTVFDPISVSEFFHQFGSKLDTLVCDNLSWNTEAGKDLFIHKLNH